MAYEPKEWQCGDTITAEDLNRMEQGIAQGGGGSAPLKVHVTDDGEGTLVLDKTWQEIYDAFPNVLVEHSFESGDGMTVTRTNAVSELEAYFVEEQPEASMYSLSVGSDPYDTTDPNGYPTNGGK